MRTEQTRNINLTCNKIQLLSPDYITNRKQTEYDKGNRKLSEGHSTVMY